jgi:hypothetical protein
MQRALRLHAIAGTAMVGAGSLIAFAPVPPPLPDVQVPAIQLTSDPGLLGDFSSLVGDLTGAAGGAGGVGDLTGDLTGLLGGVNLSDPANLVGDFTNLLTGALPGSSAVDPTSLLTPYIDLITNTFSNLSAIGTEWLNDPAPVLQAIIANPSLIADLPSAIFSTLSNPLSITTDLTNLPLTVDLMLGAPLVLGLAGVGPLATTSGAFEALFAALSSGDPTTALGALIDAPATIPNAFLNGSEGLDLLGINIPLLNGILVPDTNVNVDVDVSTLITALNSLNSIPALNDVLGPVLTVTLPLLEALPNTDLANIAIGPFGGLSDALVNYIPQQIAAALTADPTALGSGLLGGLDLGNLSGLLDPATLLGDLTALLPDAAAGLPAMLAADLVPNLVGMLLDPMAFIPF